MKFFALVASALVLLAGCMQPLRPGHASFTNDRTHAEVSQSQNPKQETTHIYRRTEEPVLSPNSTGTTPVKVTEVIETTIGAAQKDVAREVTAKLSSMKGVVWVGILVFLFGAASFVYPPLKVIVGGSVTTSGVITLAGLAMIVLPSLIVGNEIVILGGSTAAAALYWFSHRHGRLQGLVDANKNGIDDREEK